jgi:hypothetical protein
MIDDQTSHDWRPLRSIFYALNSDDHPLYFAFLLPSDRESAIVKAVRSGKVPTRGLRRESSSSLVTGRVFEPIEGKLNTDAEVNFFLNEITVRETCVKAFENALLARKITVGEETYASVEADLREVEQWLRKYALPAEYVTPGPGRKRLPLGRERDLRKFLMKLGSSCGAEAAQRKAEDHFDAEIARERIRKARTELGIKAPTRPRNPT